MDKALSLQSLPGRCVCTRGYTITSSLSCPASCQEYNRGSSIRLLCPHAHSENVWELLSALESCFGSFVGSNSYLTPAGTQGFAPHYDDIEAFVLQLEGKKEWQVYSPRSVDETLPRFSSHDIKEDDLADPVFSATLTAGDLLYFPRGWVRCPVNLWLCIVHYHLTFTLYRLYKIWVSNHERSCRFTKPRAARIRTPCT
eukprot:SAG11_NODE_1064_length_5994_cov_4.748601_2_plen_199_part_00